MKNRMVKKYKNRFGVAYKKFGRWSLYCQSYWSYGLIHNIMDEVRRELHVGKKSVKIVKMAYVDA